MRRSTNEHTESSREVLKTNENKPPGRLICIYSGKKFLQINQEYTLWFKLRGDNNENKQFRN